MRFTAALILAALAPPALAAPADTAAAFYTVAISLHEGGIPDATTLARFRPQISARLERMLAVADKAERAYAENTKHAVPPLLEGDVFVSLFEGATAFHVSGCREQGGVADCAVELSYQAGKDAPVRWTDHALLTKSPDGWRVDNIAYGAGWDFGNKGTLQDNLRFAISNAGGK